MERDDTIEEARRLRRKGLRLAEIAEKLGVSVATASLYCRGVLPKGIPGDAGTARRRLRSRVAELYAAGTPIPEIARRLGVPASTVFDWRRQWGLERNSRAVYVTDELRERLRQGVTKDPQGRLASKAVQLYEAGFSTVEVATRLDVTPTTVGAWLKAAGVQMRRSPNERTRERLRQANLGPKRYNWKGGITREQMRRRASMYMREARLACFERDDYTCRSCGQRGGKLNAHHVWPFHRFPELIYEVSNLVTLCKSCHDEFHKAAGGHVKVAIGPFFDPDDSSSVKEETARYYVAAYSAAA